MKKPYLALFLAVLVLFSNVAFALDLPLVSGTPVVNDVQGNADVNTNVDVNVPGLNVSTDTGVNANIFTRIITGIQDFFASIFAQISAFFSVGASPAPSASVTPTPGTGTPTPSGTTQTPTPGVSGTGTLQGKVTVSPLCPVEPCNVSASQLAEMYAGKKVFVYSQTEGNLIGTADIKADGTYKTILQPGKYLLKVPSIGVRMISDGKVTVSKGLVTTYNISIDSGIR